MVFYNNGKWNEIKKIYDYLQKIVYNKITNQILFLQKLKIKLLKKYNSNQNDDKCKLTSNLTIA